MNSSKTGFGALLAPDNCAAILIDHQPFQVNTTTNVDPGVMINNVIGLAKTCKNYGVPTLLTTVVKDRGGTLLKDLQDVFPDQVPIDRTFINAWEDSRIRDWVKITGRKKLVLAALWTEVCLSFPAIHALGEGYEVYVITDASGGVSPDAHNQGIRRMVQAGATPVTWIAFLAELQRDWARAATIPGATEILMQHGGSTGSALAWEYELLGEGAGV